VDQFGAECLGDVIFVGDFVAGVVNDVVSLFVSFVGD
jgi:hypothetical protein